MTIQTKKFKRKPFENIEAIRVTRENVFEVGEWCMGDIYNVQSDSPTYIKVNVHHPLNERQTKAFVGDWVLFAGKGFKVYSNDAFTKTFDPMDEADEELPLEDLNHE